MSTDALITVVYPLVNVRGRATDRVRTWTAGQTLSRERYHVVVASDGADPSQEREVEALLGPHDELVREPGASDARLWNVGAARARTPWLVFTEGHCLASPGCLEALARQVAEKPAEVAGNFAIQNAGNQLMARLSRRWFGLLQARWRAPEEWPRIHRAGFAIRSDVFDATAGFEPQYEQFAPPLLSARLHARGVVIGQIADAAVVHIDDERMKDHHADTALFGEGQIRARSIADPVFFERYFGHAPVWSNQLRYRGRHARRMARAVLAAAVARPRESRVLAGALPPLAGAMVVGIAPRVAWHRLAIALDEFAVERLPLPAGWQWSRFLRAHARVDHCAQLQWLRRHDAPGAPRLASGRWPIESLGPDTIVGVHGLEEQAGRRFRWTEPVVLLRLTPPEGEHELRIETLALRGRPLDSVIAVVVGGRVLPRAQLAEDDEGSLVVRLTSRCSAAAADGIVIVCTPLVPAREGVGDDRLLGLPIASVALAPVHDRLEHAATA